MQVIIVSYASATSFHFHDWQRGWDEGHRARLLEKGLRVASRLRFLLPNIGCSRNGIRV